MQRPSQPAEQRLEPVVIERSKGDGWLDIPGDAASGLLDRTRTYSLGIGLDSFLLQVLKPRRLFVAIPAKDLDRVLTRGMATSAVELSIADWPDGDIGANAIVGSGVVTLIRPSPDEGALPE